MLLRGTQQQTDKKIWTDFLKAKLEEVKRLFWIFSSL
jgi:hypothetical protein